MKRTLLALIVVSLLATLAGCGEKAKSPVDAYEILTYASTGVGNRYDYARRVRNGNVHAYMHVAWTRPDGVVCVEDPELVRITIDGSKVVLFDGEIPAQRDVFLSGDDVLYLRIR